ncbi:MAG: diadenylate cyclase CdaA [Bacteroidales bacterium]
MQEIIEMWKTNFHWSQAIDILIFIFLAYQFYKLVKGSAALNISLSIIGIYIFWKLALFFKMPLTSEILDRVISMGLLAIVVVFQPEIRRFLFMLGTPDFIKQRKKHSFFKRIYLRPSYHKELDITPIIQACMHLSQGNTGALIILTQQNNLPSVISTGEKISANISNALIENIFYKNSPLHDGAIIIENNKIAAARCILPVTSNKNISENLGLRHRSAIGVTEQSDALAVIVSEQTGSISYCKFGEITYNVNASQLRDRLEEEFTEPA